MNDHLTPAAKPAGHPMDKVLQRIFKDPDVTLEGERAMIREAKKRIEARNAERDTADRAGPRQADRLAQLARATELFHTADGTAFADIAVDGHRETWAVRGAGFRHWLTRCFLNEEQCVPSAQALHEATSTLETEALAASPERTVHLRVGGLEGRLYLDLGDPAWRAVEIDTAGWRIVERPPLRFRRSPLLRALPAPEPGGSIDVLRGLLNLRSDEELALVVAWALAALRDRGPYPMLVLAGEPGSAKSTCSAMLQALIDPNAARLRALPRDEQELLAISHDGHLLAFDNLSALSPACADTLCRLVSGSGGAPGSDGDEGCSHAIGITRPMILNGIVDLVARPDLADRALFVTLPSIPANERRPEAELWRAFEAERPRLLGVLLTALAEGLRRNSETRLGRLPRMADFALWATACETALWPAGRFQTAYGGNLDSAACDLLEADPVATALVYLMEQRQSWEGTATMLQRELAAFAPNGTPPNWPGNSRALAGRIRQLAAMLRSRLDIDVTFLRQPTTRLRLILLTRGDQPPSVVLRTSRDANGRPGRKA